MHLSTIGKRRVLIVKAAAERTRRSFLFFSEIEAGRRCAIQRKIVNYALDRRCNLVSFRFDCAHSLTHTHTHHTHTKSVTSLPSRSSKTGCTIFTDQSFIVHSYVLDYPKARCRRCSFLCWISHFLVNYQKCCVLYGPFPVI